mmetsp:Transcript_20349/g.56700  ORF Transcript_20349/g.56700 Transcript_20349/m.56700 type:complete len:210 (+) Transcript_20349:178-807(+)
MYKELPSAFSLLHKAVLPIAQKQPLKYLREGFYLCECPDVGRLHAAGAAVGSLHGHPAHSGHQVLGHKGSLLCQAVDKELGGGGVSASHQQLCGHHSWAQIMDPHILDVCLGQFSAQALPQLGQGPLGCTVCSHPWSGVTICARTVHVEDMACRLVLHHPDCLFATQHHAQYIGGHNFRQLLVAQGSHGAKFVGVCAGIVDPNVDGAKL